MIDTLYDKFKPWSDGCSVWLFSDPHFDDSDCKMMCSEWPTPVEHVKNINKLVCKNDTLICLGDVGNKEYIPLLNGKIKVLIMGNHDTGKSNYTDVFDEVYEGPLFISDRILLSHEPINMDSALNIHGHIHNTQNTDYMHINITSNVVGFKPYNLKNIIKGGALKYIRGIHRKTIDAAIIKKLYSRTIYGVNNIHAGNINICVSCGEVIPEGRLVCGVCEREMI